MFNLYQCNKYGLSYWHGGGFHVDSQTGGVRSYFYGKNGNVLNFFTPDAAKRDDNRDPVWSIRNC
ncbi:hypothetical protein A6A06_25845 [Streptomyces sp. CB02923]|uniref:hypothetical protein n=1 Tax=Streptomyces sp. CB02923 TaxID=1718985 RepID=UPI00093A55BB|nr:hypothetical protein [Streptomyces sp. CB02923]OKH99024.1 hypothetical protein A6A06_25845 [Streptomyces sp. CB02923]